MRTQLQTDPRWANETIGHTNLKFKDYWCFGTSLANLSDRTPSEVNKILTDNGLINSDGMLTDKIRIAQVLGLEYHGISDRKPDYDTIIETDYYDKKPTPAKEQHFLILKADGTRIDTLPNTNPNKYRIVSYRLFKKGDQVDEREIAKQIFCHTLNGFFAAFYGRSYPDPIAQFSKDFDYWYNTHKLECAGQWVNQQINEPEFKEKWCKRSECVTSNDKYATIVALVDEYATKIKKIIGGL